MVLKKSDSWSFTRLKHFVLHFLVIYSLHWDSALKGSWSKWLRDALGSYSEISPAASLLQFPKFQVCGFVTISAYRICFYLQKFFVGSWRGCYIITAYWLLLLTEIIGHKVCWKSLCLAALISMRLRQQSALFPILIHYHLFLLSVDACKT